jgi:hypothetical protein
MRLAGAIVVAGGGWILYFGMTKSFGRVARYIVANSLDVVHSTNLVI